LFEGIFVRRVVVSTPRRTLGLSAVSFRVSSPLLTW